MSTAATVRALVGHVLVFGWTICAHAQDLNWAQKMFEKQSHDFGTVARGSDVRYRFKVSNLYEEDVHISDVRTTCGCSAAKPTKYKLPSRDVAYIEVTMNTRRFIRRKDSNLIVTFDAPLYTEVRIPLTVYIRTDIVLNPGAENFGAVDFGSPAQRKIEIAYAGRSDWAIQSVKTNSKHLSAQVVETGRGNGLVNYNLMVTLEPTTPVGLFRQQIVLVTNDANSPYVPVLVQARIEADVTVTPTVVSLGRMVPGQRKTVNVVLRGKKPFALEKIECKPDKMSFNVQLGKVTKKIHVLPITLTPPESPGKFTEEFMVTIVGRADPLTFKASGRVVGSSAK